LVNKITVSAIAAISRNHVIGKNNTMAWFIPKDLEHFKRITMGKPIIMGRKSYESLGKPLSGRPNFVISKKLKTLEDRSPTKVFEEMEAAEAGSEAKINAGPFLYASVEEGIAAAKTMAADMGVDEIFITGGGEIYKQTLPYTDRLYLTVLDRDYEGDTYFPELNWSEWNILEEITHPADPEHDRPAFTFFTLSRKSKP
jgi:dihydrofolate reductase